MGKPWKELEKKTAEALGGVRINRADDYGRSDVDVVIPGLDFIRIDCKYRAKHAHHSLVEEIREKYCGDGQFPVLVTKHHSGRREYCTSDLVLFASILKCAQEYARLYIECLEKLKTLPCQNGTEEDLKSLLKSHEKALESLLGADTLIKTKD